MDNVTNICKEGKPMSPKNKIRFLYFAILIFAAALRISFAVVNREANDYHLYVTRLIMLEKRLPEFQDCGECSHPKFFHYTMAVALQAANISADNIPAQYVFTQIVNSLLGIVTLLVIWAFIDSLSIVDERLKVIAFTLTAFNPKLIGINAQATSDTFAIFLSTLTLYFAYRFIKEEKRSMLFACLIFASLGLATKINTVAITGAVFVALLVKSYKSKRSAELLSVALFVVGVLAFSLLNPLTQYVSNYQKYGNVVVMNAAYFTFPLPSFFEKSYYLRPGLVSIQDGIFTFKYINLLEYPRLTNEATNYPAHRTSLWTQVYARAHSVHFDNWPASWASTGDEYFALTRTIYILALFPTALLVLGAIMSFTKFLTAIFSSRSSPILAEMNYGLFVAAFLSSAVFISLFSILYRDFSTMKAIFIYPAILSFPALFIEAGKVFNGNKWFIALLSTITTLLVVLYSADVIAMIIHLQSLL